MTASRMTWLICREQHQPGCESSMVHFQCCIRQDMESHVTLALESY